MKEFTKLSDTKLKIGAAQIVVKYAGRKRIVRRASVLTNMCLVPTESKQEELYLKQLLNYISSNLESVIDVGEAKKFLNGQINTF